MKPNVVLQAILAIDSIMLVTLILLQNRGVALSGTFGGDSSVHYERRGGEKLLHILTIIAAIIFVGVSFAILFVK